MLQIAHAGEVLVEARAIARADARLQIFGLAGDRVEDAAAGVELADLRVDLRGAALQEHLLEYGRRFVFRRNGDAGAGPGKAAIARVDGEGEGRKAGEDADLLGDVLIERDGIAEGAAAGMGRGGQEADVGGMSAIHVGMRDAGEDAEIVAVLLEEFQVGRRDVVAACAGGKELIGEQSQVVADGEHAARCGAGREGRRRLLRLRERGRHGIEEGEGEGDARAAEEMPAVDRRGG